MREIPGLWSCRSCTEGYLESCGVDFREDGNGCTVQASVTAILGRL